MNLFLSFRGLKCTKQYIKFGFLSRSDHTLHF
jgi:hypothetical protein